MNYHLSTEQSFDGTTLTIRFTGIDEPDICITATGPATTSIDLSFLSNGEYDMSIINEFVEDRGKLKVTDEEIVFEFKKTYNIEFVENVVKRKP